MPIFRIIIRISGGGRGRAFRGHGPPYIFNNFCYILQLNYIQMFHKIYIRAIVFPINLIKIFIMLLDLLTIDIIFFKLSLMK